MENLYLHEILPVEILDKIWNMLPLRSRATATKSSLVREYSKIIPTIPQFQRYIIHLIKNSVETSFIFELILTNKANDWSWFGSPWRDSLGSGYTYTNYLTFLAECCRRWDRPKCLLVIQQVRQNRNIEIGSRGRRRTGIRTKRKNHKAQW